MELLHNKITSKAFLQSLFCVQNEWHQHSVLVHTLRVTYYAVKGSGIKFFAAGLFHDIGKPYTAFKKDEDDIKYNEWSFTDHEEKSYQIIKNWPFLSEYTKLIVRYHYLIRDIKKTKDKNPERHKEKKAIWDSLSKEMQTDLKEFIQYDDMGKGKRRR
jgi:predicted HD phosphohydrolase